MKRNTTPARPQAIESLAPFLRLPAVLRTTGLGRSTLYRMVAEHTFPAPVKLSKRAVGWRHDDVRQWTIQRPSTSR
jgi:prophage regulatory protein